MRARLILLFAAGPMLLSATDAWATDEDARGVFVAATLGQKSMDILSQGDIRPNGRPFVSAGLEAQWIGSHSWGISAAGQWGGSFFDFNGFGTSGKVEEIAWSARVGLDWIRHFESGSMVYIGAGYEYGEARSWLENLQVAEDGPTNLLHGGFARTGVAFRTARRLWLSAEVLGSAFHGNGEISSQNAEYNWLGRSLGLVLGIRCRI